MRYAAITDRLADLGSGKWEVHALGRRLRAEGHPVIELTIGEPDVAPDARLLDACEAGMRAGRTRYSNGRGEAPLLAALAAKYAARTGRAITPDNVLCLPGTQTALYAVMMGLAEAGDKVLVPDPYYATYEAVVRAPGADVVPVRMRAEDGFHLRPEALEAAITPECRVLLLNSPHNPSGAVLSREEIAAIGAICRRHDLWIVSDEVYEQLTFGASFASPLDDPALAERTIVVSSISKSHAAPGFRAGWAVGPAEFCARLLPISESMLFGGPPFIADMTAFALTHDLPTAAIMRDHYAARADLVIRRLGHAGILRPLRPEAGMFVLVDVTATGLDGRAFAERLLAERFVSVMPGSSFGSAAEGFVRLSLTVPDDALEEACGRIADFALSLGGPAGRHAS
ncbi:pyridoxal phosphate-dependent aminotransferase [Antarcticirhabdus aurantiaca]|uniref:Pyridoxal phosphate-dependent aminotransferase n=1 Tax=Antarcticirhabdus aurantiaca TaxID=2606717 RepID=A0ACD4NMQ1_9HYPH|nr:pyridoxal phosphate-dependent aminotransferase [Antarcticirhabdus aurantiaca]WAJ28063.1 pyridoxal phosphate-dependent aminotransferase [Jeongeuplla avenae]